MITLLLGSLMATLPARAEPLWGGADHLEPGQVGVLPMVSLEPVDGYVGAAWPDLHAGQGFAGGWDVRGGLSYEVPVYHRDDGALNWGYAGPSFGEADLTVRPFTSDSFAWGIRPYSEPYGTWGLGPEVTRTRARGPVIVTARLAYLPHHPAWQVGVRHPLDGRGARLEARRSGRTHRRNGALGFH